MAGVVAICVSGAAPPTTAEDWSWAVGEALADGLPPGAPEALFEAVGSGVPGLKVHPPSTVAATAVAAMAARGRRVIAGLRRQGDRHAAVEGSPLRGAVVGDGSVSPLPTAVTRMARGIFGARAVATAAARRLDRSRL